MADIHKPDGFEGQKLLVLSDPVVAELASNPLTKYCYPTEIGYFPSARYHFRSRPSGSPGHIVILCTEGGGWVRNTDKTDIPIAKDHWFLVPAHAAHTYGADEANPWSIYWFHFQGSQTNDLAAHVLKIYGALTPIPFSSEFQRRFVILFDELHYTLSAGITDRHVLYASSVTRHMMALLLYGSQLMTQSLQQTQVAERSIALMQERLSKTLSLQELADNVGLSKTQYTHIFKMDTGRTPIDYYLHLKMQRACQYLELTDWSVKRIALMLNIHDPYYFSRLFRKLIGLYPTEYRSSRKGG